MKNNSAAEAVSGRKSRRSQSATTIKVRKARRATPSAQARREFAAMRASFRPGLERDTCLMPWLIAESVCQECSAANCGVSVDPQRW